MCSCLWCEPGSNRRHKDFQSFALPTELPHHPVKVCKNKTNRQLSKISIALLFQYFSRGYLPIRSHQLDIIDSHRHR